MAQCHASTRTEAGKQTSPSSGAGFSLGTRIPIDHICICGSHSCKMLQTKGSQHVVENESQIRKVGRGRLGGTNLVGSKNLEASGSKPPAPKLCLGFLQTHPVPERNQKSLQRTPTSKQEAGRYRQSCSKFLQTSWLIYEASQAL